MTRPALPAVHRWADLQADTPMPRISRKRIIGDKVMLSQVSLSKGFHVPAHAHENEQMAVVLAGKIRFGLGADDDARRPVVTLGPGEVLLIPAMALHSAEAIEDTVVLDVFSPPSEKTGVDR